MQKRLQILTLTVCLGLCYLRTVNIKINEQNQTETPLDIIIKEEKENTKFRQITIKNVKYKLLSELRTKIEREFVKRKDRIKYVCDFMKNNSTIFKMQKTVSKLIVDPKHNLTWCPIYKSASSMWMKNFVILSGLPTIKSLDKIKDYGSIVKQKFRNQSGFHVKLQEAKLTKKFIVVRHPFQRLLSAYRDKLENMQGRKYYYKHYGQYITQKYRDKQSNLTSLEPSFTEFLQFIAKEKVFDEHWMPFSESCLPCSINYDYILKFESLRNEYNYFIEKNNLLDYLNYSTSDHENISSQGFTDDVIAEKYFENVPAVLLVEVFNIYKYDFLLFSYSPLKYYFMTNNAN